MHDLAPSRRKLDRCREPGAPRAVHDRGLGKGVCDRFDCETQRRLGRDRSHCHGKLRVSSAAYGRSGWNAGRAEALGDRVEERVRVRGGEQALCDQPAAVLSEAQFGSGIVGDRDAAPHPQRQRRNGVAEHAGKVGGGAVEHVGEAVERAAGHEENGGVGPVVRSRGKGALQHPRRVQVQEDRREPVYEQRYLGRPDAPVDADELTLGGVEAPACVVAVPPAAVCAVPPGRCEHGRSDRRDDAGAAEIQIVPAVEKPPLLVAVDEEVSVTAGVRDHPAVFPPLAAFVRRAQRRAEVVGKRGGGVHGLDGRPVPGEVQMLGELADAAAVPERRTRGLDGIAELVPDCGRGRAQGPSSAP